MQYNYKGGQKGLRGPLPCAQQPKLKKQNHLENSDIFREVGSVTEDAVTTLLGREFYTLMTRCQNWSMLLQRRPISTALYCSRWV